MGEPLALERNREAFDADPKNLAVVNNMAAAMTLRQLPAAALPYLDDVVAAHPDWIEARLTGRRLSIS